MATPLRATTDFWYATSQAGNGSGDSAGNARAFSASHLNSTFLGSTNHTDLVIHFLAGTYSVTNTLQPNRPDAHSLKVAFVGEGTNPWDTVLLNEIAPANGSMPDNHDYVLHVRDVAEVRLENLTVDGNWQWKLDTLASQIQAGSIPHPTLAQQYKNQPVNFDAPNGYVGRVIVRNYGAIGLLPDHRFSGGVGAECFPLVVGGTDTGQTPLNGQRRPWVVEDVEIHGFHGDYFGYTTALMAHARVTSDTPGWVSADADRRLVTVQRVQVRHDGLGYRTHGEVLGFGNAANTSGTQSGRTTFTDNILLNTAIGYNGDTGQLRYVDLTNNIALNTAIGWRIDRTISSQTLGFNLSGNTLRLGPIVTYPVYRSYCWNEQYETYTDPSLILGRIRTNSLITGAFLGSINQVQYHQNWFTTPPAPRFDLSNPGGTNGVWIPFHKSPSLAAGCDQWKAVYSDGSTYALTNNRVSTLAWDFVGGTAITGDSYGTFGTNTFPALQTNRLSLAALQSGFSPAGHVERVQPLHSNRTNFYSWKTGATNSTTVSFVDKKLAGAYELVIGTPTVSSNQLVIPVRLAFQRSLLNGFVDTLYISGRKVWLEIAGHSTNSATTGTGGFATFTLPLSGITHEMLELTAYHHLVGTANPPFNPYEVAIAKARHLVGNVVWMEASPDVAVDRRPGSLQIGSLRLRRSGNLASSLTVGILPEVNGVRYATMNSHYYPLLAVAPATVTIPSGTNWVHTPTTVTFAANQAEAEVQVRPIADEVIERHVVWWKLSAPVSTNYALGHRTTASVAIYDGPEWTLHEITDDGTSFGDTQAFALNSDLNGSGQPYPKIAGLAVIEHTNVHAFSGAWWQSTVDRIETFYDTSYPASRAARVLSLSDSIAGAARHVGFKLDSSDLAQPIKAFDAGGYTNLPISTGWYQNNSAAHGISPNGTWIAGYATCFDLGGGTNFTYEKRPVFWTWSGSSMTDLRGGSPPYSNDGDGEANAVNNIGEFVGSHADIEYVVRGFRTRTNGVTIAESDHLLPPIQKYPGTEDEIPDGLILKSTAHAISSGTIDGGQYKSGIAAGWSDLYFNSSDLRPRPTTWTRRANSEANPRGKHSPIPDSYSTGTILGINGFDAAVGWLGDAIGSNRRAAYWRLWWVGPIQISDPHTVYGIDASWILSEAVAISESGAIVGNGTKNNYPRGFLLIRQASN